MMKFLSFALILFFIHVASAQFRNNTPDPVSFESKVEDPDKNILFSLYSRENSDKPQQLYVENSETLDDSNYDTSKETVFVTHGWLSSGDSDACMSIKNGFLSHADYNIIVIDWNAISKQDYIYAASRVKAIGAYVAKQIDYVISKGSKPNDIHLVGHSLGGHVMGLAGYQAKHKVLHVVGLDPASPGFEHQEPDGRISKESGGYVEIVHTSAATLGFAQPIGHVDYFPNGGSVMPGCVVDTSGSCSHSRAYYYYQESLTDPEKWYARLCDAYTSFLTGSCNDNEIVPFVRWTAQNMSRPLDKQYYLRTNEESPYGLGVPGTKPEEISLN